MFDISRGKNTFEVTGGKVRGWKGWKVRGWKGWKVGCWEDWKVWGWKTSWKLIPSTIPSLYLPHTNFLLATFGRQQPTKYTALQTCFKIRQLCPACLVLLCQFLYNTADVGFWTVTIQSVVGFLFYLVARNSVWREGLRNPPATSSLNDRLVRICVKVGAWSRILHPGVHVGLRNWSTGASPSSYSISRRNLSVMDMMCKIFRLRGIFCKKHIHMILSMRAKLN